MAYCSVCSDDIHKPKKLAAHSRVPFTQKYVLILFLFVVTPVNKVLCGRCSTLLIGVPFVALQVYAQ